MGETACSSYTDSSYSACSDSALSDSALSDSEWSADDTSPVENGTACDHDHAAGPDHDSAHEHDSGDHAASDDHGAGEPVRSRSLVGRMMLGAINLYRMTAPIRRPRCRYLPTCSEYAAEAIETHGAGRGLWLAVRRLGRCHPFGSFGFDPVPEKKK